MKYSRICYHGPFWLVPRVITLYTGFIVSNINNSKVNS